jgi:hypothetical protein
MLLALRFPQLAGNIQRLSAPMPGTDVDSSAHATHEGCIERQNVLNRDSSENAQKQNSRALASSAVC